MGTALHIAGDLSFPTCGYCGREFMPEASWKNSHRCIAAAVLPYLAEHPGLTTATLSQQTGIPYALVAKGMARARESALVDYEAEDREQGGQRYYYSARPGWAETVQRWVLQGLI